MKESVEKFKGNIFVRNGVLAVCLLVIMVFVAQLLLSVVTRHGQVRDVPDFSGLTMDEALRAAKKPDLRIEINDSLYLPARTPGIILDQNPSPGSKVKSGRRVFVTVNAFSPREATIPYVTGLSLRQAKTAIELAGFEINRLIYESDIATNNVLEERFEGQTISSGSRINARVGSRIDLVVGISGTAAHVKIPEITGFPLKEAKGRLWEAGFNVGKVNTDDGISEVNINEARVYRQSPGASSSAGLGTNVDIFITLDGKKLAN